MGMGGGRKRRDINKASVTCSACVVADDNKGHTTAPVNNVDKPGKLLSNFVSLSPHPRNKLSRGDYVKRDMSRYFMGPFSFRRL